LKQFYNIIIKLTRMDHQIENNNVELTCECGGTDIQDDPESGVMVCCDCGIEHGPIYDHSDGMYSSNTPGFSNRISRCGAPINPLCPNAGSAVTIGQGSSQRYKWGRASFAERHIMKLKRDLDQIGSKHFTAKIMDDAIMMTKQARAENPHGKFMDIPYMAAGCLVCCRRSGFSRQIDQILTIFGLVDSDDRARFNRAKTIIEQIAGETYNINLDNEDLSGMNIARTMCAELKLPEWAMESIVLINKKFYDKDILTCAIMRNKIGSIIYFVIMYTDDILARNYSIDDVTKVVGNVSANTIKKHCDTIRNEYYSGVIKYINSRRLKYDLEVLSTDVMKSKPKNKRKI